MNEQSIPLPNVTNLSFDSNILNVLRSNGRSKNPEDVNVLEIYFNLYKTIPNLYRIISEGSYFDWKKLNNKLFKMYPDAKTYYSDIYHDIIKNKTYSKSNIYDLGNGVICVLAGGLPSEYYMINYDVKDIEFVCSENIFLVKGEFTDFNKIIDIFNKCVVKEVKNITIGMVSYDDGNFYIKDFDIQNKAFELKEMDLHYGKGFKEFNEQLLSRLKEDTKGLTLFHGVSGSGKCVTGDTLIKIRNKKTGKIEEINIKNLM